MGQRSGRPHGGGGDPPATPAPRRRPDPAAVVGEHVVVTSLGRDGLGEVCLAEGPRGRVRLRLGRPAAARATLDALARLAQLRSPSVAPVLDRLLGAGGIVAVASSPDRESLAERRRRGRLDPPTLAGLGAALLDGLADLHAADLSHGAVSASSVGISVEGSPRWQDACVGSGRFASEAVARRADLRDTADMLRRLGRLEEPLEGLCEAVATGARGAPPDAAALAGAWRRACATAGLPVPPRGAAVVLPGLLPPPRRRRRPPPRWLRPAAAAAAALAAAGVVPAARSVPGGAAPARDLAAYLPDRPGMRLRYHYVEDTRQVHREGTVVVRVTDAGIVAGVRSASLGQETSDPHNLVPLPLGLAGSTLRVDRGAIGRGAPGGTVRDLVEPLTPGRSWSDGRTTSPGFSVDERRTLLGPVTLDEPAGHLDGCLVVRVRAVSRNQAGTAGAAGTTVAWYCPGVGLARAVLSGEGENDVIELVGSG